MKKVFGLVFVLTLALCSCGGGGSDDDGTPEDKAKPQMTISAPADNASLAKGSDLKLTGTFTDDVALKELYLTLIPNITKSTTGIDDPWEPAPQTIALSGVEDDLVAKKIFDESIPAECLSGTYTLKLTLRDAVGNETYLDISISIN